jgi:hypothetical protein
MPPDGKSRFATIPASKMPQRISRVTVPVSMPSDILQLVEDNNLNSNRSATIVHYIKLGLKSEGKL